MLLIKQMELHLNNKIPVNSGCSTFVLQEYPLEICVTLL